MTIKTATRIAAWCVGMTLAATLLFEAVDYLPISLLPNDSAARLVWLIRFGETRTMSVALMNAGVLVFLVVLRSQKVEAS
jgi:hypothetical protein